MGTNIDQRIVEMQFDNAQFEKGVNTSVQSLENLKKSLNLDSAVNSLSNIEKAFNKLDFSGVSNGIEEIKSHFTTLGRNIDTIVDNIVQSAISKFNSIAKSISIDQIGEGFSKYDTQTRAVQTITNATGKSVEEVNEVLANLQTYTDLTSYDFATMASTIGKFTSVGVELSKAEQAMEGIANVAAVSGAGKAEANRAMYNFAQSLSQGSVKLIDWKSIENANMATKEFKEELIKTAITLGTIEKATDTTGKIVTQTKAATKKAAAQFKETTIDYKTFNSTLSEGWLTSDVLITTLERYANREEGVGKKAFEAAKMALTYKDAMDAIKDAVSSSWMQSFQYIFGDLNEAMTLWTSFCDAIIEVTDAIGSYRNEILKGWHEQGGYNTMIETASNVWHAFRNVLDLVRDSFNSVIPPATADTLVNITNRLKEASEWLLNLFNYNGETETEEVVENLVNYAKDFEDTMKSGMSGDYIKLFQKMLIGAGYSLDKFGADGIYGSETKSAVKKLQKDLGIDQTGEWDDATRKAAILSGKFQSVEKSTEMVTKQVGDVYEYELKEVEKLYNFAHLLPSVLLEEGDKNDNVKALQDALVKIGRLDASLANGIYGPETKAAVAKLQKEYNMVNLSGYGIWDAATQEQARALGIFTETITVTERVAKTVGAQNSYMERLQDVTKGLAARWSIFTNLISLGGRIIRHVIGLFSPIADGILTIASVIGKCWVSLNNYLNETGAYDKWFNNVKKFLEPIGKILQNVGDSINAFFERHKDIDTFEELWDAVVSEFKEIEIIKTIWSKVEPVAKTISSFFSSIKNAIVAFFTADTSEGETILDKLKIRFSAFSSIGEWFAKTFSNPFEGLTDEKKNGLLSFLNWIINGISSILKMVTKLNFTQLLGAGLGIFAALKVFKGISTLLSPIKALKNISGMFSSIGDFFDTSSKAIKKNSIGKIILKISISLLLIAAAVTILASLDSKKAWNAVGMLAALSAILIAFSVLMNKFVDGGVNKSTKGLLKLSIGLILIASAVSILSNIPADSLIRGLVGIAAILLEIILYSKLMGKDSKVAGFISVAAGVLLLTVSIKRLADMSWNGILKGLVGLGAILLELAIFIKIVNGSGLKTGLISMIGVGVAVYLLSNSLKSLSELSWGSIVKGLVALGGVLLELAVFIQIINGSKSIGFFKIVGIGIAITLIAKSFSELGSMSWEGILKGIVSLGAIFLELAIFINLIKKNNPVSMLTAAVSTIAIGAALLIFVDTIRQLARIKLGALSKAVVALGVIFLEILIFMNAIKKNNPLSMLANVVAMIAIGATLKLFVDSISDLAKMDFASLLKGLVSLGALFVEISIFMKSLQGITVNISSILSLIAAAGLILVFGGTLAKISDVPWSTILAFGVTFALVITSISTALSLLSVIPVSGAITAVANLAIFIAGLMAVFTAIAGLESLTNGGLSDWLTTGAQVLGSALGTFIASIVEPFRKTTESDSSTTSFADYLSNMVSNLNGVMDQLEPFLNRVSAITEEQVKGVANLVKVLAMMSGEEILDSISGWISSALNGGEGSGSGFVDFAASLVEVVPYLKQFADEAGSINTYGLKVATIALGYFSNIAAAVLPMTGAEILDSIAAFISGDSGGSAFVSFAGKLAELAPKLVLFSLLAKDIDSSAISNAVPAVEAFSQMASATGAIIWADLISNLAAYVSGSDGFLGFVDQLIALVPKIYEFEGLLGEEIDTDKINNFVPVVTAFGELASTSASISWAELVTGIADFLTGKDTVTSFVDKMIELGPKLIVFGNTLDGLDESKAKNMGTAATVLSAFASVANEIPGTDGLVQKIFGEHDIADFGDKLSTLGTGLYKFYDATKDIPSDYSSDGYINALSSLAQVAQDIPGAGGFIQSILGEKSLETFGSQLETLGSGLYNFYDSTKDIPSDYDSEAMITALKGLVGIAKEVPGAGGFVQSIVGKKDLETFGDSLGNLGNGLGSFAESTKDIPSDYDASAMITALEGLVGIADKVPEAGGIVQSIIGEQSLETFGDSLVKLGNGLSSFATATKDIPSDYDASAPLAVLNALSEFQSGLEAQGGLVSWFTGEKNIGEFGIQIGTLGTNLDTFFKATTGIDAQKLTDIGNALNALSTAVVSTPSSEYLSAGIGGLQYIIDSLTVMDYTGFEVSGQEIINNILTGSQNQAIVKKIDYTKIGKDLLDYISSGMTENESAITTAITDVLTSAFTTGLSDQNMFAFKWLGWQLDSGLAKGIRERYYNATDAFGWVVSQAYEAGKRAAGVRSPSRMTAWLGEMMDMGLVKGLTEYSSRVTDASDSVASDAIFGVQKGLSDFSSLIFDEMPEDPVIRPVLDLSEVQAGAAGMNQIFGNQAIGVRSAAIVNDIASGAMRNEMASQQQRSSTESGEIQSTLESLNNRIDELGRRIMDMRVVTETGAIIGAIMPGIDRGLGKRAVMAERGAL